MHKQFCTYLKEDECVQIFNEYLASVHGATTELTLKRGNTYKFHIGKKECTANILWNHNNAVGQYVYPTLQPYVSGPEAPVNVIKALDKASDHWRKLKSDRFIQAKKESEGNNKNSRPVRQPSPSELARIHAENKRKELENLAKMEKEDFRTKLVGATVAQYIYLTAKAHKSPEYHVNQTVKSTDKHPYSHKKKTALNPDIDDFYIISPTLPTTNQILKFLESDKFKMPENPYGFTAKDITEQITGPKVTTPFDIEDYISKHDIRNGTGIVAARNIHGTVVNLQKFLTKPLPSGEDKIFMHNGIVNGSYYIHDMEKKTQSGYQPKAVIITEGWMTGKTIQKAVTDRDDILVLTCWNAGQLKNAVKSMVEYFPDAKIMIAIDNDVKSYSSNKLKEKIERLDRLYNTGIKLTIAAINEVKEHSDRIFTLVPQVNYKEPGAKLHSDFNDIELDEGFESAKKMIRDEIKNAVERKNDNVLETDYLVDIYNSQVHHFNKIHAHILNGKTISGIDELGAQVPISEAKIAGEQLLYSAYEESVNDDIDMKALQSMQVNSADLSGFFDVEVNDAIKTDYERALEEESGLLSKKGRVSEGVNVLNETLTPEDKVSAIQTLTAEHKPTEPSVIINPSLMTAMLYEHYTLSLINNAIDQPGITTPVDAIEAAQKPNKEVLLMGAILDPVMSPHVGAEIEKYIQKYESEPFFKDLTDIADSISENFISYTAETNEIIRESQRGITTAIISQRYDLGIDEEITQKILDTDITKRDKSEKQAFYRELRSALDSLDALADSKWISNVKDAIETSKTISSNIQTNGQTSEKEKELKHDVNIAI